MLRLPLCFAYTLFYNYAVASNLVQTVVVVVVVIIIIQVVYTVFSGTSGYHQVI